MAFGVLTTGFNRKLLADLLAEIEAAEKAAISPTLNTLPSSVLGQLNGIYADKLREAWEVLEAVYDAHYPDSADALSLDAVAAITGALRLAATQSTVTLSVNLNAGVTLPAGSVVSIVATGARFETLAAVTNSGGSAADFNVDCVSSDFGAIPGPAQSIRKIETPVTGWNEVAATILSANAQTYALSNGMNLLVKVDDGAVQTVTFLTGDFAIIGAATAAEVAAKIDSVLIGAGSAADTNKVRITSDEDGPASAIHVTGGTSNTALGFSTSRLVGSPFNVLDAVLGREIETDVALRIRREQLLRSTGTATVEAIKSRVLDVDNVLQVYVFENTTLLTDIDGIPGKAFEVVVRGGTDLDVAQAIFDNKAAGIQAYGSTTQVIVDSQGISHTIGFSRPTAIPIWIDVTVTTDGNYPADGDNQLKAILVALGGTLQIGDDVIYERFQAECFQISGVVDVPLFEIGTAPSPTGTSNIPIATRQLATFDTSRIVIV